MVTHATALAVVFLRGGDVANARANAGSTRPVTACSWDPNGHLEDGSTFGCMAVDDLLLGIDVKLPTCPECAVLVDAALEAR